MENIRRSHLIFNSGVGGLTILRDGTAVICAGLDYWFRLLNGKEDSSTRAQNTIRDWRLERRLGVSEFRTPPAAPSDQPWGARRKSTDSAEVVPFLRFPLWHVCPLCRRLEQRKNMTGAEIRCEHCKKQKKWRTGPTMIQVPLVAACKNGHLQEFPWEKWLSGCSCKSKELELRPSGGTGLGNYRISCRRCKASKSLGGALREDKLGKCDGNRPWLVDAEKQQCNESLQGILRNSASIHFPNVVSSVFLPEEDVTISPDLRRALQEGLKPAIFGIIASLKDDVVQLAEILQGTNNAVFGEFDPIELGNAAIQFADTHSVPSEIVSETDYRKSEYDIFTEDVDISEDNLVTKHVPGKRYQFRFPSLIEDVALVESLLVTNAYLGFSRVLPADSTVSPRVLSSRLWNKYPEKIDNRWLPAVQVRGEGIFVKFSEKALSEWENRESVKARVGALLESANKSRSVNVESDSISTRFVLLHTFSHVLINRLVFEAGYSAASISERIYARPGDDDSAMAGVLIYTASGDSEGSLGGLVRLGNPGILERLIDDAIEVTRWCSNDPVCMEIGGTRGQGREGLNLAACHSCVHLPETSCENFNTLLDRALLVGSLENDDIAFFK